MAAERDFVSVRRERGGVSKVQRAFAFHMKRKKAVFKKDGVVLLSVLPESTLIETFSNTNQY